MVDTVEGGSIHAETWERACGARRGNLRVGHKRGLAHTEQVRSDRGNAIQQARERKRLNLANVGASETRDIANQAETEMIVKKTEAATNNSFRRGRPGETYPR